MRQEKLGKIGEKQYVHNTTPILKINFQVIERGIMTIINGRRIILTEEADKIQISHIEMMQGIEMSMDEVGNHLFGMRKIMQELPYMLRVVIALLVDQIFQPAPFSSRVHDIICYDLLSPYPFSFTFPRTFFPFP